MRRDAARSRLAALGFGDADAGVLADHFLDAERRGKRGHGLARIDWLETLPDLDPTARPVRTASSPGFDRWEGRGALGYLTLAAIADDLVRRPPQPAKVVVARDCVPTGALGYWVRRLADAGLVAVLTATSPARLPHPDGGPAVVGTNPLAIGVPADGGPVVADVSMGRATYGDVLAGVATPDELVPFGGEHAHKAFALALGLQLLVDSQVGDGHGAVLVALRDEFGPSGVRERLRGLRIPGDR
ncbi:MAG: Ldh family oxidoreductase [Thermoleophilia bacterium]|nr:Ldh family oxidoreductase [Thermoleophilia bacterium]